MPSLKSRTAAITLLLSFLCVTSGSSRDYAPVALLFREHCVDCHSADDPEGKLVLESFDALMKGGESGAAILPGNSTDSLLVKMIEGRFEKDGKARFMPPGKREKLSSEQISRIKVWIDAGAPPPVAGEPVRKEIQVPDVRPRTPPNNSIHALAYEPKSRSLAAARVGKVDVYAANDQSILRSLAGFRGKVHTVLFTADGNYLWAAGGESGLAGRVQQWRITGEPLLGFEAHPDSIYALAISPGGKILATGSYDQKIKLWNAETGEALRTLSGHNGAVYGLAFRADGKILASASGDRTVKLWDVSTGERRDTLSQPLKEVYTVAFSPDGSRLAAAGVDNRIRIWQISDSAAETTNPLLISKFAHESAILRLAFSADGKSIASSAEDRSVKLWAASDLKERLVLPLQPDWATGLSFFGDDKGLAVGRLDGSLAFYSSDQGAVLPLPKPQITRVTPRGVQRGIASTISIHGKHLRTVKRLIFPKGEFRTEILPGQSGEQLTVRITPAATLRRDSYDFAVSDEIASSQPLKLYVDDIAQAGENSETLPLPVTVWGHHQSPGEADRYRFKAAPGETLVFDAAASTIGSKASLVLTLLDPSGKVLASSNGFESRPDPLLTYRFEQEGTYTLAVGQLQLGGSDDHFYRISIGAFRYVTALFPSLLSSNSADQLLLIGPNISSNDVISLRASSETVTPELDPNRYRWAAPFQLRVANHPHVVESEPNDRVDNAGSVPSPGVISGRIEKRGDEDWFRFEGRSGHPLVIETTAAQLGSPLDSVIEVRDALGKPVPRIMLQAVRDSAVTFRGIDSVTVDCRVENWEEMELNQYLYLQGEVVRLFRAPQGPDSGFNFYASNGKRRTYYDTTATAHANAEPCYIVEPHPPGAKLVPNGLPVFTLNYENDDDAGRRLGSDSRLHFSPPTDGAYFVRVRDARGFGGDNFVYQLTIRDAQPGFRVALNGANPTVPRGSGQAFSVSAERLDGFEGEIRIDFSGLPAGLSISSPVVIQDGHTSASGALFAAPDAVIEPSHDPVQITATATIQGTTITQKVNSFGKISLVDSAPLYVSLEPSATGPTEITISPGQTVPAWLKVRRNGHNDLITFNLDNLPHGIIVDNIGLNGVLIPKDQNEREIFISAAKWVPETDRWCHAISNEGGRQTSRPVLIKVRNSSGSVAAR